jgi:hypothetical protein
MDALNAPSICDDKMREARAHERSNDRRMSHLSVVDNETSSIESTSPHSTMHSSVVLFRLVMFKLFIFFALIKKAISNIIYTVTHKE